jgi:hypothetical protein
MPDGSTKVKQSMPKEGRLPAGRKNYLLAHAHVRATLKIIRYLGNAAPTQGLASHTCEHLTRVGNTLGHAGVDLFVFDTVADADIHKNDYLVRIIRSCKHYFMCARHPTPSQLNQ